jgi:hypothetical protein
VDILQRARDGVGPVLHDNACDTLGFVVPPGTADGWDVPGSQCTRTSGRGMRINIDNVHNTDNTDNTDNIHNADNTDARGDEAPRTAIEPPGTGAGTGWLVPPDAAYTVATDPVELRAALGEAARTIEAVDRCQ